jgi:hypothetical protein
MTSLVGILRNFFLPDPAGLAPSVAANDRADVTALFDSSSIMSASVANLAPSRPPAAPGQGSAAAPGAAMVARPLTPPSQPAVPAAAPLGWHEAADWVALNLAHELNQPLAAIANYVRAGQRLLASGQPADLDRLGAALDAAMNQALHAGRIVGGLRAFVTRGENERGIESLPGLIQRAIALATPEIDKHAVTVTTALDAAAQHVMVDRVQIEQVLLNLIRNAVQAMQDSPRRDLCIASRGVADRVEITVTDTGGGLPEALRAQIFAPFVTTRRDGMGLGLAICHAIVAAHGGNLSCQPAGRGSSFRFTIPRVTDPMLADPGLADPLLAEPVLADPVLADPVAADPKVADATT